MTRCLFAGLTVLLGLTQSMAADPVAAGRLVELCGWLPLAVQIAELPDAVRGYEDIKLRNVERYREQLTQLREQYAGVLV